MGFTDIGKKVSGALKLIVCGEIGPWGAWIDLPNGERKTFESSEEMIEFLKKYGWQYYGHPEHERRC